MSRFLSNTRIEIDRHRASFSSTATLQTNRPEGKSFFSGSRLPRINGFKFLPVGLPGSIHCACCYLIGIRPRVRSIRPVFSVTVLGSGSAGNCSLIATSQCRLLVDAGFSARQITQRLESLGVRPECLDGILITHEHSDHVCGPGNFQSPLLRSDLCQSAYCGNVAPGIAGRFSKLEPVCHRCRIFGEGY